jgi:hypothetical protein
MRTRVDLTDNWQNSTLKWRVWDGKKIDSFHEHREGAEARQRSLNRIATGQGVQNADD